MIPFHPAWHYFFDGLAFLTAAAVFRRSSAPGFSAVHEESGYWLAVGLSAFLAAYGFGTLNLSLATFRIGHSIAGGLVGGIAGAEIYKWRRKISGSTGSVFVLPLAAGLVVGRWGCFMAGLPDETFGTPTDVPWGVDFGDGLRRHPVQLYESFSLALFVAACYLWRRARPQAFRRVGFYVFVFYYAVQRFAWEFLKPYTPVLGPLNIFHLVCLGLAIYSLYMLKEAYGNLESRAQD